MIDAMLRQAQEQQHVDILNYLKSIRNDRPYMVQTVVSKTRQRLRINKSPPGVGSVKNKRKPIPGENSAELKKKKTMKAWDSVFF